MATESDIIAILFSLSGMRGMYSRYMTGPDKAQSLGDLQRFLAGDFPELSVPALGSVALQAWHAFGGGGDLTSQLQGVQAGFGGFLPADGTVASIPGLDATIPISYAGIMPGFDVPGVPGAQVTIPAVATITAVNPAGLLETFTTQITTVWIGMPTLGEVIAEVIDGTIDNARNTNYGQLEAQVFDTGIQIDIRFPFVVSTTDRI